MKSILILGANPETAGLVLKARQMGLYTYVTDNNPRAYAKRFADCRLDIDATDVDALARFVREHNVDGVLVGVADALLSSYCRLCGELDLSCFVTPGQVEVMASKDRFKAACRQYGVPVVEEYDPDRPEAMAFPVVVKPVDSSSSKGISVCASREALPAAMERALGYSRSRRLLIERYMTGDEVVIYYIIREGEPTPVAMCDRYTNREQPGLAPLPTAYIFPSRHLPGYLRDADGPVRALLRGLGLRNGTLFLQAFVDGSGQLRVYEPGFRLNGAQEHILVSAVTGIDAKELLLRFALTGRMGDAPLASRAAPDFRGKWGCKLSPLVRTGRIARLEGLEAIARQPGVLSVNPSYDPGDTVIGPGTLKQIICRFFLLADSWAALKQRIDAVQAALTVEDDAGRSMLLTPFSPDAVSRLYE